MATTAELLSDAEAAYHKLMTGQAVARFKDQNGEEVQYTAASASKLLSYINGLKGQTAGGTPSGPMRVFF